jgi:3-hydroxyisobutyrate dehydrogenase-like beta-hydroxyacid dehydrogenase
MKIGWIGLGKIGTAMVLQLRAAGHDVTVYARGQGLEQARAAGAAVSDDYATIAAASGLLGLCLFHDDQVRDVLFGGGALAALPAGAILVNHTTGSPLLAQEIAEHAPDGVATIDAAFSGGETTIEAGKLLVMAGGPAEAVERARSALSAYAGTIVPLGGPGQGQTVKLLNNLLFASNLHNASSLLRIAQQQGLDPADVAKIIGLGSGGSFALRSFESGSSIDDTLARSRPYLVKDVGTLGRTAADAAIDISAFAATLSFFSDHSAPQKRIS